MARDLRNGQRARRRLQRRGRHQPRDVVDGHLIDGVVDARAGAELDAALGQADQEVVRVGGACLFIAGDVLWVVLVRQPVITVC